MHKNRTNACTAKGYFLNYQANRIVQGYSHQTIAEPGQPFEQLVRKNSFLSPELRPYFEGMTNGQSQEPAYTRIQQIGLVLGPLSYCLCRLYVAPTGLSEVGVSVLATTLWVAFWWISEAAPMAVTGLMPVILFSLSGALPLGDTTRAYAHPMIFLFLGGFVLALAMEKWNLHRRIALAILTKVGSHSRQIVLGFMLATGFLSMWISNTATTVMMLPIGMAVIAQMDPKSRINPVNKSQGMGSPFGKALMLGIAYSASIGGVATLVGTPTNPIFAGVAESLYGVNISFAQWMILGLPISILLMAFAWLYLTRWAFPLHRSLAGGVDFSEQKKDLGPMKLEEKVTLIVFILVATCWIVGKYTLGSIIPGINDTAIALVGATALFLWPAKQAVGRIMNWEDTQKLPWGILILFGGGLCIAEGFKTSGLAVWIGEQLSVLEFWPLIIIILVIVALVNFLTEVTSNVATASMILPILAALAEAIGVHPFTLMVGATVAASCAFMLPVATAPNAVVFGSGQLRIPNMVKAGFVINLVSIVVITLLVYFLLPALWDLTSFAPNG